MKSSTKTKSKSLKCGPLAELVDAHDLKSCVFGRPGSSPGGATTFSFFIELLFRCI